MANHVAVVTDSTASIPNHLVRQWGIKVVQVQIVLEDRMDDENRFDRLEIAGSLQAGKHVSTSPPDPGAFFWAYQDAVIEGAAAVVSLHLSERLSQTVEAAREAAQGVRIPVYILDSRTTGMSLGFAVLSAARAAQAGAGVDRTIQAAHERFANSTELLFVDTLEYLRRGGRIGGAAAMLGTALSIKPLLTVASGEVKPLSRVPGTQRAMNKLLDLAIKRAGGRQVDLAVSCWKKGPRELKLVQELKTYVPGVRDIMVVEASTVIGAHVGPGALSITVSPV